MLKYTNKKAQAILEYSAVIIIVAVGLVGISSYLKRNLQGRYKQAADVYGDGFLYSSSGTVRQQDVDK